MSTDELQRQLARIAERAPVADIPPDTWRRARGAVVRGRIAAVAVALASVGGIAAGVAWLPDRGDPPVADGPPGVPHRIQNAPTYFTDKDFDDLTYSGDVETDLAVGQGAVAYATAEGVPVVVDAASGGYHLLALPGFTGRSGALELSPDGERLAYSYADPLKQKKNSDPMPTGLRIVDLETGDTREIPLRGGMGVAVYSIHWSPNGTWLLWGGSKTSEWDRGGTGSTGRSLMGVVAPGGSDSREVKPALRHYTAAAVSDSGEIMLVSANSTSRQGVGDPVVYEVAEPSQSLHRPVFASFTDAGMSALVAEPDGYGYRIREFLDRQPPVLDYGRRVGPPDRAMVPLGYVGSDQLLVRTGDEVQDNGMTPGSGRDDQQKLSELAILDTTTSELTVIGAIDSGTPSISVATDLVGPDRPTVERPVQHWPFEWTGPRAALVMIGGFAAIVLAVIGLAWWQRRSRRDFRPLNPDFRQSNPEF